MKTLIAPLLFLLAVPSTVAAPNHPEFKPGELTLHDDNPEFCGTCAWANMDFSCDFRIKYLMQHYHMTEDGAKQSLLDAEFCHVIVDAEADGGQSFKEESEGSEIAAAAPIATIEGDEQSIEESEVSDPSGGVSPVSEIAAPAEAESEGSEIAAAAPIATISPSKPKEETVLSFSHQEQQETVDVSKGGTDGTTAFLIIAMLLVASITVVEHRRRKRLEQELAMFRYNVEEERRHGQYTGPNYMDDPPGVEFVEV